MTVYDPLIGRGYVDPFLKAVQELHTKFAGIEVGFQATQDSVYRLENYMREAVKQVNDQAIQIKSIEDCAVTAKERLTDHILNHKWWATYTVGIVTLIMTVFAFLKTHLLSKTTP